MSAHRAAGAWIVVVPLVGGCTAANLPTLPSLSSLTSEVATNSVQSAPIETSLTASGTSTGVFTNVARGVLGCWFAADGPLKASHVYRAEAEPPSKGGAAEVAVYERDRSVRDQRGARAYRISFADEAGGVHVSTTALKFEAAKAQAMARDVETWAKGGNSCQLRALSPPSSAPLSAKPAKGSKLAKGSGASKKQ
jgi:hypothetical protein